MTSSNPSPKIPTYLSANRRETKISEVSASKAECIGWTKTTYQNMVECFGKPMRGIPWHEWRIELAIAPAIWAVVVIVDSRPCSEPVEGDLEYNIFSNRHSWKERDLVVSLVEQILD